jgi:hypothetical protein
MNPCCLLTGHFVSPTGFDPWTGLRHDYSPSENDQQKWVRWNRACYGANSASRILNAEGKIRDIVNNYRQLNFSVAPALLDELSRSSPNVYRRLQEADAASVARWGHGNALARPWREVILPLLPADRAALQIDWGLEAFRHHFGRDAEGFCLPHDAVSTGVLDLLVERRLKFVLLSPSQAEGTMPLGAGSWQSLGGSPAPGDRAFQIDRPGGSIAAFFPDERLSRGLVQDHLLRDAGRLEDALRNALKATGFVHLSVPGETFGLTEPFADMCLAALWERLGGASPVDCSNYGHVLAQRPPRELVKLKKGDDELGTSSDCPHGVARWYRDCGCRSSASHQQWKQPLWNTLVQWESDLRADVDQQVADVGVGPASFRAALPDLVFGRVEPRAWARALVPRRGGDEDRGREDRLIVAARCFQSVQNFLDADLWDGDDPTSPQGREALLWTLRTLDFAPRRTLDQYLGSLETILINDGRSLAAFVAQELVPRRHDPRFAAALLLLDRILRPRARYEDAIGPLSVAEFTRSRHEIDDEVFRFTGMVRLHDADLDQDVDFDYLLLEDHKEGVSLYLKESASTGKPEAFDLQYLPVGDRTEIVHLMGNDLEGNLASETQAIFPLLRKSLVYARLLDVPPLPMARSLMELAVTRKILGMTENGEVPDAEVMDALEEELTFAKDFSLQLDFERLNSRFSRWLAQALGDPAAYTSEEVVKSVETLLAALGRWGFRPDLTVAQALVFEALRDKAPQLLVALEDGKIEALGELKRLLRLASLLLIDTSAIKNRVLDF